MLTEIHCSGRKSHLGAMVERQFNQLLWVEDNSLSSYVIELIWNAMLSLQFLKLMQ
jgi:hypothetical protein